jgi:nucleotide-binding universal stress UspA family protein
MNEIHGNMIAMATHGRTGLAHFFKGSIAEGVLNRI